MIGRFSKILLVFVVVLLPLSSCGDESSAEKTEKTIKTEKTPETVSDHVVFLQAESALPKFPFGENPIYMFFYAYWCPYSKAMREEIFTRPEIIEYLNKHFTCIGIVPDSIDQIEFLGTTYSRQELLSNFKIEDYPAHFFCSPEGKLVGATKGEIGIREFKLLLMYYAEGHFQDSDLDTFLESDEAAAIDTVYGEF